MSRKKEKKNKPAGDDKVLYINKIDPVSFRTKDLKIRFFFEIFRSDDGLFFVYLIHSDCGAETSC